MLNIRVGAKGSPKCIVICNELFILIYVYFLINNGFGIILKFSKQIVTNFQIS
jgi:hypothetical protein